MRVKEISTINSVEDFRLTLFNLFYGGDNLNIFVEVDGNIELINLNEINTFDDITNLGKDVFLTPKMIYNWGRICDNYNEYKNLFIHQENETFLNYIKNKQEWVHSKNHNLRFMLEKIFPEKYIKYVTDNSIII